LNSKIKYNILRNINFEIQHLN